MFVQSNIFMVVKGGRIEGIPVRKGWRRVGEERHPRHGFHSGPFGATTSVEKFFLAAVAGHQIPRNMPTIMGFRIINLLYRVYYSNTVSLPSSCSSCPRVVALNWWFFFFYETLAKRRGDNCCNPWICSSLGEELVERRIDRTKKETNVSRFFLLDSERSLHFDLTTSSPPFVSTIQPFPSPRVWKMYPKPNNRPHGISFFKHWVELLVRKRKLTKIRINSINFPFIPRLNTAQP